MDWNDINDLLIALKPHIYQPQPEDPPKSEQSLSRKRKELPQVQCKNITADDCFDWVTNFNNWIRIILIHEGISMLPEEEELKIMDFAENKQQFQKYQITEYQNFHGKEFLYQNQNNAASNIIFAPFILQDHFRSGNQIRKLISFVSNSLCEGGIFMGIVPDASVIMYRLRHRLRLRNKTISNSLYSVTPHFNIREELSTPLDYTIRVNSSERKEYLVPKPIFEKEALRENLDLVHWTNAQQFYADHKDNDQYRKWWKLLNLNDYNVSEDEWDLCKLFAVFVFKKNTLPEC
jgi:hypothetical protein